MAVYNENKLGELKDFVSSSYNMADTTAMLLCGTKGRYLEIGANKPIASNNTALLELNGWTGISLEMSPRFEKMWADAGRKPTLVTCDATTFNYDGLEDKHFDFIQYDIDPSPNTFKCFIQTMKAGLTAKFITYEHDAYRHPDFRAYKIQARNMLKSRGYKLLFDEVPVLDSSWRKHEDWYVAEDVIVPFDYRPECWHDFADKYLTYYVPHTRKVERTGGK